MYKRNTIVSIRPLSRQPDGEEVVIGNRETGVFLAVPPEAIQFLDQLAAGKTVGEVADLHFEATGENLDLADFLGFLETKGLVAPDDAETNGERKTLPRHEPTYHFSGFPQRLAQMLFSRPVFVCQALLAAIALTLVLRNHSLMPVPADLVFSDHRALGLTALTAIAYASVFLHEMAHLVAARALGVNSRMAISHRLWYLVVETDLTGLWSVSRRQRYLPMLAGMIFDTAFTALIILVLFAGQHRLFLLSPFSEHLLRATAFTNLMRILWEFFLFTRTDVYFLAATFLNCKNLLNDTRVFLQNQMARFSRRTTVVDQSGIPPRERRAIRYYSVLYLAGRAWAVGSLFWVTIPFFKSYGVNLLGAFHAGYSANPSDFADAVLASLFFLVPTTAGFVLWGRTLFAQKVRSKGV
jgi:hypothetical protein